MSNRLLISGAADFRHALDSDRSKIGIDCHQLVDFLVVLANWHIPRQTNSGNSQDRWQ
jgi:hypothetical protein